MKLVLLPLIFSLIFVSCVEVRDPHKKNEALPTSYNTIPSVEVRPLAHPHEYAVLIKSDNTIFQITRKSVGLLNQMADQKITVSNTEVEDIVNRPGLYNYTVQLENQSYQLQVDIPEDYVIEGNMQLSQLSLNLKKYDDEFSILETSGRLYFKAGSCLTTNGENLLIKVGQVESEGSVIQTFPIYQKAQMGIPGRHGGHIQIVAQALRGTLHMIMRGEDGGDGESSTILIPKPIDKLNNNGFNGGNSGFLEVLIDDKIKGAITYELIPGDGGLGVEIYTFCLSGHCDKRLYKPKGHDGFKGVAQQPFGVM